MAGDRHDTGHCLDFAVVAGFGAGRTGLAEAGDRAVDQARVDLGQCLVAQTESVHHAGAEVFHDDVGLCGELQDDVSGGGLLQVQGQAFLVAVHRDERGRHVSFCPFP